MNQNTLNINVGDILYHYDDGKIKLSRQSKVIITKIVEYKDIDKETKALFEEIIKDEFNNQFYLLNTSHFIFAETFNTKDKETYIYVQYKDNWNNGWFSFNSSFSDGELDISNKLTSLIL